MDARAYPAEGQLRGNNMKKFWERIKDTWYGILPWLLILGIPLLVIAGQIYLNLSRPPRNDGKEIRTYDTGYEEGYKIGYQVAMSEAPERIQADIDYDLDHLIMDIGEDWKMSPGEAILILEHYADGEPVSDADVKKAVWVIHQYYWGAYEIMTGVDNYWID